VKFENEKAYEETVLMYNTARKLAYQSHYISDYASASRTPPRSIFRGIKMDKNALEILEKISGNSKTVIINVKKILQKSFKAQ